MRWRGEQKRKQTPRWLTLREQHGRRLGCRPAGRILLLLLLLFLLLRLLLLFLLLRLLLLLKSCHRSD